MKVKKEDYQNILSAITYIQRKLTKEQLLYLISILEENDKPLLDCSLLSSLNINPKIKDEILWYLKDIATEERISTFCLGLTILVNSKDEPPTEICWTGPPSEENVRLTRPAILELIHGAISDIWIVDYSFTLYVPDVLNALEDRAKKGVKIVLMVDRLDEKIDIIRWARGLDRTPELYSRPKNPVDEMTKLHIKCLVVDKRAAMFGSANMSHHGLRDNIELGIIIRDKTRVRTIVELLSCLKRSLTEVPLFR